MLKNFLISIQNHPLSVNRLPRFYFFRNRRSSNVLFCNKCLNYSIRGLGLLPNPNPGLTIFLSSRNLFKPFIRVWSPLSINFFLSSGLILKYFNAPTAKTRDPITWYYAKLFVAGLSDKISNVLVNPLSLGTRELLKGCKPQMFVSIRITSNKFSSPKRRIKKWVKKKFTNTLWR